MRAISLFAGCGGADIALKKLGVDVVYANDVMSEACDTLRSFNPHTEVVHGDIRELDKFPDVDLVVGGYPCQSFSLAGNRKPSNDPRTFLYLEFARVVDQVKPKFFIAENVSGLKGIDGGAWFQQQIELFEGLADGYHVTYSLADAKNFGVPQSRKRVFIVGVRADLGMQYRFPEPTHGSLKERRKNPFLLPFTSHGEAIKHIPLDAPGEFYERPHDETGHMSWYYMSRNRKAKWLEPAFCVVANFRHITLHPASNTMELIWSNLADGFKQKWDFTDDYEHLLHDPTLPTLEVPRRLSWRECAAIQTFPENFEPSGNLQKKFEQIGNAIPPQLLEKIASGLISGLGLEKTKFLSSPPQQLTLFE